MQYMFVNEAFYYFESVIHFPLALHVDPEH